MLQAKVKHQRSSNREANDGMVLMVFMVFMVFMVSIGGASHFGSSLLTACRRTAVSPHITDACT